MKVKNINKGTWAKFLFLILFFASSVVKADGKSDFNKGLSAYRAKDYRTAVTYFEKARQQGLTEVSVFYNLGATYYRLGELDKSIQMFERVIKSGQMKDAAYFNLGLIARKQNKNQLAVHYFNSTIQVSKNLKLTYLARENLREMGQQVGIWKTTALVESGFNDNVSNNATGLVGGGDVYLTLAAFTHALISGSQSSGWHAHGEIFKRSYSTIQGYGLASISGGVSRNASVFGKNAYVGGYYKAQMLDSADYQKIAGFEAGVKDRTSSGALYDYRYRLENIDAAPVYSYLQGTRQRFRIQRIGELGKSSSLILAYRYEINNRQNSSTASYTNVRQGIRATYFLTAGERTTWKVSARYRVSDYTPVAAQDRYDNLLQFSIERRKRINENGLEWTLKYSFMRNDSTDPNYAYTSNTYQVGLRKSF